MSSATRPAGFQLTSVAGGARASHESADNGALTQGNARLRTTTTSTTAPSNGIAYHGGPVLTATTKVYELWNGNWSTVSTPARQQLIDTFLRGLGGTPWFNTNTSYYNGSGARVQNVLSVGGSYTVPGTYSTSLSDLGVSYVVTAALKNGALPSDPNGIYLVFTSKDVAETSGFLTKYCGWHTATTYSTNVIKYGFVGDPSANLAACSAQSVSPNGDAPGDAMVSVIAHEIAEVVSDPQLNAWYTASGGQENGDLCAWKFGALTYLPSGAAYNTTWTYNATSYQYLIQQLWANASGGYCTLTY